MLSTVKFICLQYHVISLILQQIRLGELGLPLFVSRNFFSFLFWLCSFSSPPMQNCSLKGKRRHCPLVKVSQLTSLLITGQLQIARSVCLAATDTLQTSQGTDGTALLGNPGRGMGVQRKGDVLKAVSCVVISVFKQVLNPSRLKPQDTLPPSQELHFQAQHHSS